MPSCPVSLLRSLNPKKLIEVGFSRLAPRMTLARTIKLHKLPDTPETPRLRQLEPHDVPQVSESDLHACRP